ncbi:MAG TPA: hypothetical protein VGL75_05380 [Acidothermaceae bacterium]
MLDEFERDVAADVLYISPRLNTYGRTHWPFLLRAALAYGVPAVLARDLAALAVFNDFETAPGIGENLNPQQRVPDDANVRLAEIEFNRFYARAVCRRALQTGAQAVVEVYVARKGMAPGWNARDLVGTTIPAAELLATLRRGITLGAALGLGDPSALSVSLPSAAAS